MKSITCFASLLLGIAPSLTSANCLGEANGEVLCLAQASAAHEYSEISGVSANQAIECGKNGRISGVHRNGVGSAQSFDEPVIFVVQAPHEKIGDLEYVRVTANGEIVALREEPADYRMYTLIFECNY